MPVLQILACLSLIVGFLASDHYPPWLSFHGEVCALLALFLLSMDAVIRQRGRVFIPVEALLLGVLACVPWVQLAFGLVDSSGVALLVSTYFLVLAFAVLLGGGYVGAQGGRHVVMFVAIALWLALVSAGLALYQAFDLGYLGSWVVSIPPGGRSGGNLAQPNQLALLLIFGVVAAAYLFERRIIHRFTLAASMALLGLAVAATQSRAGLLELAWIFAWSLVVSRQCALRVRPWHWLVFAIGVMCVGFFFSSAVAWVRDPILGPDGVLIDPSRLEAGLRTLHWRILLDAIWQQPWWGYGAGQVSFAHASAALRNPPVMEWMTYSHNIFLDFIVWFGIPVGTTVSCAAALWFVRRLISASSLQAGHAVAALGCFGLYALLEYPHAYAYFLVPAGVLVGQLSSRQLGWAVSRVWVTALGVVVFGLLAVVARDYVVVEGDFRKLRMQHARIGALVVEPEVPELLVLDQLEDMLFAGRVEPTEGMRPKDLDRMRNASLLYQFPPLLAKAALAQGLNGRYEDASFTLRLLCRRHHPSYCDETVKSWRGDYMLRYPQLKLVQLPADDERVLLLR